MGHSSETLIGIRMLTVKIALLQTGSTLARTNLSPFARCTLGLNRHSPANIFIKIYYATQCFTSNREMVNFFAILTTNSVTTGARELNGTSLMSLATHNSKADMREI